MAPLEEQVVPINLGTGLDTKTDSKQVQGKVLLLENALFTAPKRISKRPGYSVISPTVFSGSPLVSLMNKSLNGELISVDGMNVYSYSQTNGTWINKGSYRSIKTTDFFPFVNNSNSAFYDETSSGAVLGNYLLLTKSSGGTVSYKGLNATAYVSIFDTQTNGLIYTATLSTPFANTVQYSKAVVLGNTALAVFYTNNSGQLESKVYTITSGSVAVVTKTYAFVAGNTNVFSSDGTVSGNAFPQFDVIPTSTGAALVYATAAAGGGTPTDLIVDTVDTTGTVVNTATITGEGASSPLCISQNSDGKYWVYWATNGTLTNENLNGIIYNTNLTVFKAKTTILTGKKYISQITVYSPNTGAQFVYYSNRPTSGDLTAFQLRTLFVDSTLTSLSDVLLIWGFDIYSKILTYGSTQYLTIVYPFDPQKTLFLYDVTNTNGGFLFAGAKALPGASDGFQIPSSISGSFNLSATQFGVPCCKELGTSAQAANAVIDISCAGYVLFDFNSTDAFQGRVFGNSLMLNGSILAQYDGRTVSELGFNLFPKIDSAVPQAGGSLGVGSYLYSVIYRWTDNNGDLHQSAPGQITVTTTNTNKEVQLQFKTLKLTQKNVNIALFRTAVNGTISYLIVETTNPSSSDSTTYLDVLADTAITSKEILYTNGGIIENTAPPPTMLLTENNDRLWAVDSENPNTVSYSKPKTPGFGTSFSDLLTFQEDSIGGDIKAISAMDGKFVSFKKEKILYHAGDGANDVGTGSTLSLAQLIPTDTGCSASKSVIVFPNGILFKSDKGIYLLDRSLSVGYLGSDVEAYNTQDITSAVMMPKKNHIRFLTSSGSSLVYDYFASQWSVFTNHTGLAADIWQGLYVYTRTDGTIYSENSTNFLDNATAYKIKVQLAWIKMAGIQGYQRIRRVGLLGAFQGAAGHGVRISAAYDFGTTFSTPVPYSFSGANASFQYRERLPIQKCDSLGILIEEITTGASGEYIDLTDLSLEVGVKKGINKLQASQTVG